jgi:hypothetical protein
VAFRAGHFSGAQRPPTRARKKTQKILMPWRSGQKQHDQIQGAIVAELPWKWFKEMNLQRGIEFPPRGACRRPCSNNFWPCKKRRKKKKKPQRREEKKNSTTRPKMNTYSN